MNEFIETISEPAAQAFLMRILTAALIYLCAFELVGSSRQIGNRRLPFILYRVGIALAVFFAARLLAAVLDSLFNFSIGLFSNVVNVGFWLFCYFKARALRRRLASDAVGAGGRARVARAFDEILNELDLTKEKLKVFRSK